MPKIRFIFRQPGSVRRHYGYVIADEPPLTIPWQHAERQRDGTMRVIESRTLARAGDQDGFPFYEEPSALFSPTVGQYQTSQLLCALAASGKTEREVIAVMHEENERLLRDLLRMSALSPGSPRSQVG